MVCSTLTLSLYHLTLYFCMGYGMYCFSNAVKGSFNFFLTLYFGMGYSMLWYVFNAFYFVSLYGLLVCGLYKCISFLYVLIKAIL